MSIRMAVIAMYLRLAKKPKTATPERADRSIRAAKTLARPPRAMCKRHIVTHRRVGEFITYTVRPRERAVTKSAIYLHGGAYISEIVKQHWALISQLADAGVRVEVPIYGLAPQHSFRQAYPLLDSVYRQLADEVDASTITLIGDSAGGGLALGFAQTLPQERLRQPGRIVLISPWMDLTLSNPAITEVDDPWLTTTGLTAAAQAWADGAELSDPRLSPINGSTAALAPIDIFIGTRDLFYPDALRVRALDLRETLRLTVCHGAVHVYPLVPAPEGRRAAKAIVALCSGHTTTSR
ncbi:alpha/beta hydrolase fold domain-containing protein [Nocardia goodfellowii]|uniref:Acetyl esterase/lipase n=1 Tax=Nocardia goodfellowii TaxID=882446 RepID=A0ABS4QEW5_9NOCA|nr:alpha/beta hydrolase [Nocardia goodfellowii]MBP2190212.1 acetyl esterase/lipase [Nocardia goodfellowii]